MTIDQELDKLRADRELHRLVDELRGLHDQLFSALVTGETDWIADVRQQCDEAARQFRSHVTVRALARRMRDDGMTLAEAVDQCCHEGACIKAMAPRPQ